MIAAILSRTCLLSGQSAIKIEHLLATPILKLKSDTVLKFSNQMY